MRYFTLSQHRLPAQPHKDGKLDLASSGFAIIVFATSILFGGVAALLPWWIVLAFVIAIAFLIVGLSLPSLSLVAIVAIVSGLVHSAILPEFKMIGGTVQASDIGLVLATIFCLIRYYSDVRAGLTALRPLRLPLLLFLCLIALAVLRALFVLKVPIKDVLGESRHFMYWFLAPLFAIVAIDRRRFHLVVYGLIVVALLFSVGQVLQGMFGLTVFSRGARLEGLNTMGDVSSSVMRSITQGIHWIIWAFLCAQIFLSQRTPHPIGTIFLSLLTLVGIFLGFGRMEWAGTALAFAYVGARVGIRHLGRGLLLLSLAGVLAMCTVAVVRPNALQAGVDRLTSVTGEVSHGKSLAWRYYEIEMAWASIKKYPILGIGMGSAYRPPASSDVVPEQVRYVHSSYVFLWLKAGLLGLLAFLWLAFAITRRAFVLAKAHDSFASMIGLAFSSVLIEFFLTSFTQPEFMQGPGIAFLATIGGLVCGATFGWAKENVKGLK